MESSIRRSSIKEKLEHLRLEQNAVTIQSIWRGHSVRKQILPQKASGTMTTDNDEKKSVDEDEDDNELEDKDEENMEEMAVLSEQRSIVDFVHSKKMASPINKNRAGDFLSIEDDWPKPLMEDFNSPSWPPISDNDEVTEDWVYKNKCLYIRAITWNLCAKKPPPVHEAQKILFPPNKFHIYAIGSEECERSIAQSAVNPSKKNWESYISEALGPNYHPIRAQTLQAIHVIVYAHKSIAYLCSEVSSGAVPTGIGNTLGNKGGVGIQFTVGATKIVIVNAHLAAHQKAVKQRNADFEKIDKEMPFSLRRRSTIRKGDRVSRNSSRSVAAEGDGPVNQETISAVSKLRSSGSYIWRTAASREGSNTMEHLRKVLRDPALPPSLSNYGDRVIFMGDLNYRIRGNRSAVSKLIDMNMHEVMISNDQLIWCKKSGLVLKDFSEPPLHFKPTYKLDRNSDEYDTGPKKRIPAWTDRILYVNKGISCLAYNSDPTLRTSDHRPVYASFKIEVDLDEMDALKALEEVPTATAFVTPSVNTTNSKTGNTKATDEPEESQERLHATVANNRMSMSKTRSQEFVSESAVCSIM